ncbi:molybdenum cofactor guanylyltransferase MobA [Mesobacterium sp. TK19101]|uniref:Molybdenum cofactor guanylyltransferase n=1 Tax=Mesobacterium hydrothermale TaxID=3111907 RepID=A0ABU6HNF0_9RHOB|nr:molybdenum cofactor guanylyltransferase MobA [Mesobacterium sp. TK19101]MEC3862715.1 molybdenum cofactor guanylyltransferase MobA [Mesobacterium sp. TK19101]
MATDLPAVILAGGQGSRMGGADKALLNLGGVPLLRHVLDRLAPQVGQVALNANGDPARFQAFGLPVLPDSVAGFPGPLAGVLAAMDWAAGLGAAQVVTVAADTPFFPRDLVARLAQAAGAGVALAAVEVADRGVLRHPTFGLWPVTLRDDLREALEGGTRKVRAFADAHGASDAVVPAGAFDPFFNINRAEDLARAEAML